MHVKKIFFVFLLFSISFYAQNKIDKNTATEEMESKTNFHLGKVFDTSDANQSVIHAKQAVLYAGLSVNDTLLMKSYHAMAHAYKKKRDYNHTKENTYKSLALAKKLNDTYFLFLCNNLLGIVNASEKQYQLSTEYYNNALAITKETHDTINESLIYHNIAINYYCIDKFELAKMFMSKSEEVHQSINVFEDSFRENFDYIYIYMKKSLVTDVKKEALLYANKAIARASEKDFNDYLSITYKYKGRVYLKHEDFDLALEYFKKTLTLERKNNGESTDTYIELINALVKTKQHNEAKQYVDTLFQSFSYTDVRSIYLNKNKVLAEVYQNAENFDKALFYANKRAVISDSLLKLNNYELFAEFGKKFETKEKENEIKHQQLVIEQQKNENKNILLYNFSGLFIVLLLFQWVYYTLRSKKRKMELAYVKEHEFNQVRTSFLENISHEIRTPLTLINGYLNLINEKTGDDPKIKEYINNALLNSKKVIFDADEILSLLKYEDHKMSLKIVQKSLNEFLKEVFLSFEVLANTRSIELIYKSKIPANYNVDIDAIKVEKILTNLISNAIKFSNSNSKVIVEVEILGKNLEIKVIDFGQGVEDKEQARIFRRFYQSKNNKSVGGIGIGLLLSKDFAQFLGGNITLKSKIGKGSTFKFTMPLSDTKIIEESIEVLSTNGNGVRLVAGKNTKAPVIDANKPSILIVEDSIEMTNYLKEILVPFYNCTFAFDGLEGVDLAKKQTFDLVTSDVMMPKVDGYEFKELLKSLPEYATVPFILITAKSLPEDKTKGFAIGIDDYITKPFNKEELIVRINNLLKNNKELKLSIATPNKSAEDIAETHTEKLVNQVKKIILENLSNENFKVEDLALQINYSQRQLARILNRHTGLSSIKFIQEIKLREAYKLIESKKFKTISEVQYEVGITSPSYFSEKFKNRFGINPSELMRKQNV